MLPVSEHFVLPAAMPVHYARKAMDSCAIEKLGDKLYTRGTRNYVEGCAQPECLLSYDALVVALRLSVDIFVHSKSWVPIQADIETGLRVRRMNDSSDNKIVDYTGKYGLMATDMADGRTYCHEDTPNSMEEIAKLDFVVEALYDLLILYLCWCYVEWEERGDYTWIIRQQAEWNWEAQSSSEDDWSFLYNDEGPQARQQAQHDTIMREPLDALCRELIQNEAGKRDFSLVHAYEGNRLVAGVQVGELHDALAYQLLELISAGEHARDGRIADICKQCGAQYMKRHGNASLCETCRTPKAKAKAFRERQKAVKKEKGNA